MVDWTTWTLDPAKKALHNPQMFILSYTHNKTVLHEVKLSFMETSEKTTLTEPEIDASAERHVPHYWRSKKSR